MAKILQHSTNEEKLDCAALIKIWNFLVGTFILVSSQIIHIIFGEYIIYGLLAINRYLVKVVTFMCA